MAADDGTSYRAGNGQSWRLSGACGIAVARGEAQHSDWVRNPGPMSKRNQLAQAICGICPVSAECLAAARKETASHIIRGGQLMKYRPNALRKREREEGLRKHGTPAARQRHKRRGEEYCEICKREINGARDRL